MARKARNIRIQWKQRSHFEATIQESDIWMACHGKPFQCTLWHVFVNYDPSGTFQRLICLKSAQYYKTTCRCVKPGFSLNYDNNFLFIFCIVSKAFTPDTSNDLGSYYNKYIVDYMIADQVSWNKLSDKYMTWLYWCVRLCKVIWSRIWLLDFSFSTCRSYLIAYLQDDYVPRPGWGMRATSLQIVGKCSRHLLEVESFTIKLKLGICSMGSRDTTYPS